MESRLPPLFPQWLYAVYRALDVRGGLFQTTVWANNPQALPMSWVRAGADFIHARSERVVTLETLLWGYSESILVTKRLTGERRCRHRTISRGAMVRKKASRLQVLAATRSQWTCFSICKSTFKVFNSGSAGWLSPLSAVLLYLDKIKARPLPALVLKSTCRYQRSTAIGILRYAAVAAPVVSLYSESSQTSLEVRYAR